MQACGVAVSHELTITEIEDFVDPKLQHGKSALKDTSCDQNIEQLQMPTSWKSNRHEDLVLYREIMRYDYDNNIGDDNWWCNSDGGDNCDSDGSDNGFTI